MYKLVDGLGNITHQKWNSLGKLSEVITPLNRNISKIVPKIGKSIYQYDLPSDKAGQYCEQTTDPKGNVTSKTYDEVGRLSAVTVGDDTTMYKYYANGRRYRTIYPDGTTETYVYDKNNQVKSLINAKEDRSTISSYQYTYDAAGNQLTKKEAKGTTIYEYDYLNRLSKVTEPEGKETSYTYDAAGNRKTELIRNGLVANNIIYSYNEQNGLISTLSTSGEETKYIYDNNGILLVNILVSVSWKL